MIMLQAKTRISSQGPNNVKQQQQQQQQQEEKQMTA